MQHKKQTVIFSVQGLLFFSTAAPNAATGCFAAHFPGGTNQTGHETGSLGASLARSRAEGGSGPALPTYWPATSPWGDTGGLPPTPPQQPFQHIRHWRWHQRSCVMRGAAAVTLPELFFQPGDTKAKPSTLSEIPLNQQKTAGKMKVPSWWSTAVPDKRNIAINKALIYCGKKNTGSGKEVGKGEKQKNISGEERKSDTQWDGHS